MNPHQETNPHFVRPLQEVSFEPDFPGDQPNLRPTTATPWSGREHRPHHRSGHSHRPRNQPQNRPEKQPLPATLPLVPLHNELPDEQNRLQPPRGPRLQRDPFPRRRGGEGGVIGSSVGDLDDHKLPLVPHQERPHQQPSHEDPRQRHRRHDGGIAGLIMPESRRTRAHTWFLAVFCAVLWLVVILGGLIVLVVYLVFRPHSPRFEVSAATLNAAYLDGGYLLNADLTLLANFTNPNRKVGIEFSYMYTELYYGRALVATQYLEPFTARRGQNTFANVHMVTSQVRLPELEIQRIKRQASNNNIAFELKGYFRAKSNFGRLFRYSYWLHSRCTIVLTRPPGGVLVARSCKTSH